LISGVVPGIILGLLIALIGLIVEVSRPGDAVLKRPGPGRKFRDFGVESVEGESIDGLLVYRLYAPLIYANARHVTNRLRQLITSANVPVQWLIIDAQAITDMDITAAQRFAEFLHESHTLGVAVKIADTTYPFRRQLERMGLPHILEPGYLFPTVKKAVEAYEALLSPIQELELLAQEPDSDPFTILLRREGSNLTVSCTCGENDEEKTCDHRLAVLRGDFTALNLLNIEEHEIQNLTRMIQGTDVELAWSRLASTEKLMQEIQKDYQQAKDQIIKAMND
ncbi:MAG: sodium-independent anion transporter, partial [Magnetococcales bacterium]|nr:sodium-independent anion transporter [Magnetococcales bacterium]